MATRESGIFGLVKSPTALFVIALAAGAFGIYYWLAQSVQLPGSEGLRERWGMQTTRRGVKGNRMHRPRASGPLDLTLIGGVCAFSLWQGLKTKNRTQERQP